MRDALLAALILTCIWTQAKAGDWSVGVLLGSNHPYSDGTRCDGVHRDYVEDNLGVFVRYKYLLVGRYENSYGNCNGFDYSNLLGVEAPLGQLGPVEFSVMAAIADGYPEFDSAIILAPIAVLVFGIAVYTVQQLFGG